MAISTVQQAFTEFEETTRVPSDQNDRAKDVHREVRAVVKAHLGELFNRDHLAGSYARRVQTVYLKDIDIVVVLNDPDGSFARSASAALERLREAAKSCDLVGTPTRKGIRAIKVPIIGEEFTVDLVAALEDPFAEVRLARFIDGEYDDWTSERPRAQVDVHFERNQACDGHFVPAVRIVKHFNQRMQYKGKRLLPSYLMESILFDSMSAKTDYDAAMLAFFEKAESHLSTPWPSVPCPGNSGRCVDELLDSDRREYALEKISAAHGHARDALAKDDPKDAMDCWAKVFGPAFPAPSGDDSNLAEALRAGAKISGITVVTGGAAARSPIVPRAWRP